MDTVVHLHMKELTSQSKYSTVSCLAFALVGGVWRIPYCSVFKQRQKKREQLVLSPVEYPHWDL